GPEPRPAADDGENRRAVRRRALEPRSVRQPRAPKNRGPTWVTATIPRDTRSFARGAGRQVVSFPRPTLCAAFLDMLGARAIPDPTTAGDFCRRFDEAAIWRLMRVINGRALRTDPVASGPGNVAGSDLAPPLARPDPSRAARLGGALPRLRSISHALRGGAAASCQSPDSAVLDRRCKHIVPHRAPTPHAGSRRSRGAAPARPALARSQLPAPARRAVARSQPPAPARWAVARSQLPAPARRALARSQPPAPMRRAVARSQLPAPARRAVARVGSPAPARWAVARSQVPAPARRALGRSRSPARARRAPGRSRSPARARRALARETAPARRVVARVRSPVQPLAQVASCRSCADAAAPRTLAALGAEARAGSPRACRDRADRRPPRAGRRTPARR